MSDTPRTALDALKAQGELVKKFYDDKIARLERELAAAIEQCDKARKEAAKELMDCKGYDLFPDGTMRPAHGFGEWVRAEDYDKLHAEIAMLRKEKNS